MQASVMQERQTANSYLEFTFLCNLIPRWLDFRDKKIQLPPAGEAINRDQRSGMSAQLCARLPTPPHSFLGNTTLTALEKQKILQRSTRLRLQKVAVYHSPCAHPHLKQTTYHRLTQSCAQHHLHSSQLVIKYWKVELDTDRFKNRYRDAPCYDNARVENIKKLIRARQKKFKNGRQSSRCKQKERHENSY